MLIFFVIQTFLYLISIVFGYQLSKNINNKTYFWIIVITFTLIEGLRFGRGIDYNLYVSYYNDLVNYNYVDSELSFVFNNYIRILGYLNMPFQALIISCSFVLIYAGLKFLMRWPKVLMFSLPIFVFLSHSAENLFKWYTGFAFLLLASNALYNKNNIIAIVYSIISVGIHPMLLPIILLYYVISLSPKTIMPVWMALSIYVLSSFIFTRDFMLNFVGIVNFFLQDMTYYSGYADDAAGWLTGSNKNELVIPLTTHIKNFIYYVCYLIIGNKMVAKDSSLLFPYNLLLLGVAIQPMTMSIELMSRYGQLFTIFACLIGGYAYYSVLIKKQFSNLKILAILLLLWQVKMIGTQNLPGHEYFTLYIWDAGNRESLPLESYPSEWSD